jgi:SAM-dependent methyltransferase
MLPFRKPRREPAPPPEPESWTVAYDPALIPPLPLMRTEGIDVLEEWFRWGEEWSMLLRVYGGLTRRSAVLEIGCGLGRTAFPLRYLLSSEGRYDGFEIARQKVEFLARTFTPAFPNFRFTWADVRNTYYNPAGRVEPAEYRFPYPDRHFDIVYAASVFTHMVPENAAHYLQETARVLRPGGRALVSVFLLDHYDPARPRPLGFARDDFRFDHAYGGWGDEFRTVVPENPEQMTAYRRSLLERLARQAGLRFAAPVVPGLWSGAAERWVGAQDLLALEPVIAS